MARLPAFKLRRSHFKDPRVCGEREILSMQSMALADLGLEDNCRVLRLTAIM